MNKFLLAGALATLAVCAVPAQATLVARDLDGNPVTVEAYYDAAQHITWMRDRNHLAQVTPGLVPTGYVNWADGDAAIAALNANAAAGYGLSGWRMPTANGVASIGGPGCQVGFNGSTDCGSNVDTASSELAYMFHVHLGNLSQRDTTGAVRAGSFGVDFGLVNDEDFLNLETGRYWSSTDSFRLIFGAPLNGKVSFDFSDGSQSVFAPTTGTRGFVWLVHDGDVGSAIGSQINAVPEPAALTLAGVSLLALWGMRRRTDAPRSST